MSHRKRRSLSPGFFFALALKIDEPHHTGFFSRRNVKKMLHGEEPLGVWFDSAGQTLHVKYTDELVTLSAIPREEHAQLVTSRSLCWIMEDETFNFEGLHEHTFKNSVPEPTFTRVGSHNRSWK